MSSIPNAVIPHAIERAPQEPAKSGRASAKLVKLALVPPLMALGLGAFAFSALRSLASELARKIDANAGSASTEAPPRENAPGVPV